MGERVLLPEEVDRIRMKNKGKQREERASRDWCFLHTLSKGIYSFTV